MRHHPLFLFSVPLVAILCACSSKADSFKADPFKADKPVGPVKPALYEPPKGVYLGAALDTSQVKGEATAFLTKQMADYNLLAGKKQALQMQFIQFPNPSGEFGDWNRDPNGWISAAKFVKACENNGAAPILTLEPFVPQLFLDWKSGSKAFEATKAFAQSVGAFKKPIFIRFAHEMNGSWYPWGEWVDKNRNMQRDADESTNFTAENYRTVFRNVAKMFRQYAPNAAMVWCPNSGLLGGEKRDVFRPFYPGDDVVDWVGLDIYERGWTLPQPGAKLWGGQFARHLNYDMADDPATEANESANFYLIYSEWKKKPLMICETSSTLSYRSDLKAPERAKMNSDWKIGYWNSSEYGWMQGVYGTSTYPMKLINPIDTKYPMIKAIVWFQIGKREFLPAEKSPGQFVWFNNEWADYRIGGGIEENVESEYSQREIEVFRSLTRGNYFLSSVQATNLR
jgi:hypothetical protein